MNPYGFLQHFPDLGGSYMQDMEGFVSRILALNQELLKLHEKTLDLFLNDDGNGHKDSAAAENALTELARKNGAVGNQYHRTFKRWLKQLIQDFPGLSDQQRKRTLFWADQFILSMAPQNFFWSNPSAVKTVLDSHSKSLENSCITWIEETTQGNPFAPLVDRTAFSIGENLATTPGSVVYRNSIMEVIQYAPVTSKTRERPIVLIQPLINKYYIFDLSESNSFVRFLIREGFTVFITSWKNPTADMRDVSFEDYMIHGALEAIMIASKVCRTERVHAAGYCIGGTLLAALMAWLNFPEKDPARIPVADWTLFSTLVDFSEPGPLMAFTEPVIVEFVEAVMAERGFLDSRYLQTAFRMLKADNLIWRPHVTAYLQGQPPPISDVLYWNSDGTRLTEALGSFLLRTLYKENRLIEKNGLSLAKRPIDLKKISQPLYVVGAKQDHICPWESTFAICGQVKAPVRYVLASEGHITGIVNPPAAKSKKKFKANDASGRRDPQKWLQKQDISRASWWEDWSKWLSARGGPMVNPPVAGGGVYRPLEKAPGSYVHAS
jgi:polyhydroxyalkanoate synthase